jgi:hypothetical protein
VGHRRTAGVPPCASSRLRGSDNAGDHVRAVGCRRDPECLSAHSRPGSLQRRALQVFGSQRSARQIACVGCDMRRAWQSGVAGDSGGPRRSSGPGRSLAVSSGPRPFGSLYIR